VPESETAKAADAMERATRPEKICMIRDLALDEEVGYSSGEQSVKRFEVLYTRISSESGVFLKNRSKISCQILTSGPTVWYLSVGNSQGM